MSSDYLDLDSTSLRLSSQGILGCVTLIVFPSQRETRRNSWVSFISVVKASFIFQLSNAKTLFMKDLIILDYSQVLVSFVFLIASTSIPVAEQPVYLLI